MYNIELDAMPKKTKKVMKLRKGRVTLMITFLVFLVLDIFLVAEYKARGSNAIGYQLMEKVNHIITSGNSFIGGLWDSDLNHDGTLTSALIVGVDTRSVAYNGKEFYSTSPEGQYGTRNTDTIIQVVYDHNDGNLFMISIPRDMGVDVVKDCLEFHGSLHWVYDKSQTANCPGGGVQTLIETIEGITGIPVHYYGFVSLEAFADIISTVGDTNEQGEKGIWIDNPTPVYELYPINETGWESVYFPEGRQFLTAEQALKYARSRKASSDFARARRQQIVIKAVKDRVVSSDTLLSPKKILGLLDVFRKKTIISDISVGEMKAALDIVRDLQDSHMYDIVLDPDLGGKEVLINKQPHDKNTAQYYMVPTSWKECPGNEFCRVKEFLKKIFEHPDIYNEKAKISVYGRNYNSDGKPNLDSILYQRVKDEGLPLQIVESAYLANIIRSDTVVLYDFSEGTKPETLNMLSTLLATTPVDGSEASYIRLNQEDFAIVVNATNE